uniref:Uncharacterized protein n=1 Tax=Cyprinus carpio TaxID=7962 RepID=A0A8C2HLE9_CYPCA
MASTKEILEMDLYALLGIQSSASEKQVMFNISFNNLPQASNDVPLCISCVLKMVLDVKTLMWAVLLI